MNNTRFNQYLLFYYFFQIIILFLFRAFIFFRIIEYIYINYIIYTGLILNIAFIITMFIKKKEKLLKFDFILILYVLMGIISTIFAYNKSIALFGANYRYEGLLTIIYYITLIFLGRFFPKEKTTIILKCIVYTGIIESLVGIIQFMDHQQYIIGFTGNSNFYGTYINLCLWITIYLLLMERNKYYYLLLILFSFALILSYTLSCILSSIIGMILLFVISICEKQIKLSIPIIICLFSILSFSAILNIHNIGNKLFNFSKETVELSKGNFNDNIGTNRMYLWKKTIKYIPKYFMHGIGIDNFQFLDNGNPLYYPWYDKKTQQEKRQFFDKAHNDYLQILITEGVFSLIVYLIIVSYILYQSYKWNKYFALIILTYLIQIFFNISVVEVAPIFYLILGLGSMGKKKTL